MSRKDLAQLLFWAVVIAVIIIIQGCSALNPLSMFSPKPSVEVTANVGKNVKQDKSALKIEQGKTEQTADTISNDTSYKADVVNQITNNLTWWQMVALIIMAGAALPSFGQMYKGLRIIITDTSQAFIVYPIRTISNFVLRLFKRKEYVVPSDPQK